MFDVVVVGRANVDLLLSVPRIPRAGLTTFASGLHVRPGGKGLNQACAAARLGAATAFVCGIGDDQWGGLLRDALVQNKVDTTHTISRKDTTSGAAVIEITPDGASHIVVAISEPTELTPSDIESAAAALRNGRVTVLQLDLPPAATMAAISTATGTIVGNLVPHAGLPTDQLSAVDIFVVNEIEAGRILDIPAGSTLDVSSALHALTGLGARSAVITLGAAGAAWINEDGVEERCTAPSAEVVDTTGAGDSFIAAMGFQIARGATLATAVQSGVLAGSAAVETLGGQLPAR
jgi:ribokinase